MLQNGVYNHRQFANNAEGMEELMHWIKTLEVDFSRTLFCMEATGLYCFVLTEFLAQNEIDTWIEHAAQIKKSTALDQGKNDKVDSRRIPFMLLETRTACGCGGPPLPPCSK